MRISVWSSDVCSSDLVARDPRLSAAGIALLLQPVRGGGVESPRAPRTLLSGRARRPDRHRHHRRVARIDRAQQFPAIGRASCRERVGQYVEISEVAVTLKKKKKITPKTPNKNQ